MEEDSKIPEIEVEEMAFKEDNGNVSEDIQQKSKEELEDSDSHSDTPPLVR